MRGRGRGPRQGASASPRRSSSTPMGTKIRRSRSRSRPICVGRGVPRVSSGSFRTLGSRCDGRIACDRAPAAGDAAVGSRNGHSYGPRVVAGGSGSPRGRRTSSARTPDPPEPHTGVTGELRGPGVLTAGGAALTRRKQRSLEPTGPGCGAFASTSNPPAGSRLLLLCIGHVQLTKSREVPYGVAEHIEQGRTCPSSTKSPR